MYNMYKIRLGCTSKDNLCFNGKKITKKLYTQILNKLQPENIDYIETISILYKTSNKSTINH